MIKQLLRAIHVLPLLSLAAAGACLADDLNAPVPDLTLDPDTSAGPLPHFVHNRDSIPDRPPLVVPTDGSLTFNTRSDLRNDRGSVAIDRSDISLNLVFGPEHPVQLSIPIDYEASNYRFHQGATPFVPGGADAVRSVYLLTLTPNLEVKIDDQWSLFMGSVITIAGQNDAGTDDGLSIGGFFGFKYTFSKSFNFRLGLLGVTQLSDDPLILPAGAFEWKLDERTRLVCEGPELRFEYDINEAWTVKCVGSYDLRAYRLSPGGTLPTGVMRDTSVPITARLEFTPHAAIRFEGWAGVNAYQKIRFDDREGGLYQRATLNPSFQFGLSFEIIF